MTGKRIAARIGAPRLDLTRELDPANPGWDWHLQDVAEHRPFRDFVMTVEMPAGTKHLSVAGAPYYGTDGRYLGYRGTTRDVTARVEAEREAARQTEILISLIENLPLGVSLVGPDLRYLAFNSEFLAGFDLSRHDLKPGDSFEKFVRHLAARGEYGAGDTEELVETRMARLSSRARERFDAPRADGRVIEVRIVPLVGGGFVTTRVDVTEDRRRQAELDRKTRELIAAAQKVQQANAAKSLFLANMSHELRTPLNAILGFSDILAGEKVPLLTARFREYARDINASGSYLLRLINDLLDISKVEIGELRLREEPVDLAEVVRECERLVWDKAQTGDVQVQISRATPFPLVEADRLRLKQIVLNLMANAVKFTPPGGQVTVSVARPDTGGVSIVIADTGIGMAAADIPRALEPFRQIEHTFARRYDGAGLGLPLAKNFTELHGGRLTVRSQPGKGTEVEVWLPATRVLEAPARTAPRSRTGTGA